MADLGDFCNLGDNDSMRIPDPHADDVLGSARNSRLWLAQNIPDCQPKSYS